MTFVLIILYCIFILTGFFNYKPPWAGLWIWRRRGTLSCVRMAPLVLRMVQGEQVLQLEANGSTWDNNILWHHVAPTLPPILSRTQLAFFVSCFLKLLLLLIMIRQHRVDSMCNHTSTGVWHIWNLWGSKAPLLLSGQIMGLTPM